MRGKNLEAGVRHKRETRKGAQRNRSGTVILALVALVVVTGCAGRKNTQEPVLQRGWVGGQYKLAHTPRLFSPRDTVPAFPTNLTHIQEAGILVMRLDTNAPAYAAGLREGDLILKVDHERVTNLRAFRSCVEDKMPGSMLPVDFWRNGEPQQTQICVGRESYRRQGTISLGLIIHDFNFCTDPGFSLAVLGYQPNPGTRPDLAAVDQEFARKTAGSPEAGQQDWAIWLAVLEVAKGKIVISQQPVSTEQNP